MSNKHFSFFSLIFLSLISISVLSFKYDTFQFDSIESCEKSVELTYRSCLNNNKCFHHKFTDSSSNILSSINPSYLSSQHSFSQSISSLPSTYVLSNFDDKILQNSDSSIVFSRYAVLIPDKKLLNLFFQLTKSILKKSSSGNSPSTNIIYYFSTHVPPYGYGENHGLTKVLRFVEPLSAQAVQIVEDLLEQVGGNNNNFEQLFHVQLKQLIRWHCRINHFSAHTTILTIQAYSFIQHPSIELQKILSFLGFNYSPSELQNDLISIEPHLNSIYNLWTKRKQIYGDILSSSYATPSLSLLNTSLSKEIIKIFQNEFSSTNNLSAWPCKVFSNLNSITTSNLSTSSLDLSPDCYGKDTNFQKCSVDLDKKESKIL